MSGIGKLSTKDETYKGSFGEGYYNGEGILKRSDKVIEGKWYNGQIL
jgi:hypothetical protein